MTSASTYPIGTPGKPWGEAERVQWRARLQRQRSYAHDVLQPLETLGRHWDLVPYGVLDHAGERHALVALRSRGWRAQAPTVLVTGGVHGYETSGVLGVLEFAQQLGPAYAAGFNLLLVPCVSPWAYERVQRWNHDAIDPNRNFRTSSPAPECAALMALVAPLHGQFAAHVDLHETTDSDETEFRPALAARDGQAFVPGSIPEGFYVVDDAAYPQPAFQQGILAAVARHTPIAQADALGQRLDAPMVAPGVIHYPMQALGLCASITGARYTCTTEVYPDGAGTTPAQCRQAQVAAVSAALEFLARQPAP